MKEAGEILRGWLFYLSTKSIISGFLRKDSCAGNGLGCTKERRIVGLLWKKASKGKESSGP